MTAAKLATSILYAHERPSRSMITPPSAGPAMRHVFPHDLVERQRRGELFGGHEVGGHGQPGRQRQAPEPGDEAGPDVDEGERRMPGEGTDEQPGSTPTLGRTGARSSRRRSTASIRGPPSSGGKRQRDELDQPDEPDRGGRVGEGEHLDEHRDQGDLGTGL